jgi:excisionase family DNA binding protein
MGGKMNNQLLTSSQVAERLAISRATLYRLTGEGKLVPVRIGRAVRFRPEDVDKLIEESLDKPDPDAWGPRAGIGWAGR